MKFLCAKFLKAYNIKLPEITDEASYTFVARDLYMGADFLVYEELLQEITARLEQSLHNHSPRKFRSLFANKKYSYL